MSLSRQRSKSKAKIQESEEEIRPCAQEKVFRYFPTCIERIARAMFHLSDEMFRSVALNCTVTTLSVNPAVSLVCV